MFSTSHSLIKERTVFPYDCICLCNNLMVFPLRTQKLRITSHFYFSIFNRAVWRFQETHFVDLGMYTQSRNQSNIGSFRCLNGTQTTIVRIVDMSYFKSFTLPRQSPQLGRATRRE